MVLPEIDIPGHMQAAVAAYPELGCTKESLIPRNIWGISRHILNPFPSTIAFLQDVLDEVLDLFPSPYIHIGGDEALKDEWEESKPVQEYMAKIGVKMSWNYRAGSSGS